MFACFPVDPPSLLKNCKTVFAVSIKLKEAQKTDEQILKFRVLILFASFVCELLKSSELCRTVITTVISVRKQFFILAKISLTKK